MRTGEHKGMRILIRSKSAELWEAVGATRFSAEAELQGLLSEDPSLIPLPEIQNSTPPLAVAVTEFPIPGVGNADIVAFTPRGDVAVVECKLARNTDKRRVIAQVFDYASVLWGITYEELDSCIQRVRSDKLADLMREASDDPTWDESVFRRNVASSLSSGNFFLVIAVDEIDDNLRRFVSYLNLTGKPGFTLAVLAMGRFQNGVSEVLVPQIYAPQMSGPSSPPETSQWDEERFFSACEVRLTPASMDLLRDIYAWGRESADRFGFGQGMTIGSLNYYIEHPEREIYIFQATTDGFIFLQYGFMIKPLGKNALQRFHNALRLIPSFANIPEDFSKYPGIRIEEHLANHPEDMERFKSAVESLQREVKAGTAK